ncbi:MAG: hypothetical protein ACI8PZ_006649 [Myxococcota bacterium]
MILLAWLGCGGEDRAVAEMERALEATNDALSVTLVAHELFRHLADEGGGTRHGTAFGCPALEQTGPDASHVLLLDYPPTGCVASELLPPRVAGHVWLDVTGDDGALARVETASVGGEPLTGELEATVRADGETVRLTLRGPLEVGAVSVDLDVDVHVVDFGALTVDGTVDTLGGTLRLREVVLEPEDVHGPCPVPSAGRATWSRDREVTLALGERDVPAESGRFVGTGSLCRYIAPFWP